MEDPSLDIRRWWTAKMNGCTRTGFDEPANGYESPMLTILLIIVLVLVLTGGGLGLSRRRR